MKQIMLLVLLTCSRCTLPTDKASILPPNMREVRICLIADRSLSFIKKYYLDPAICKPLCDTIITKATLDFRYGCVFANSDVELTRYYVPYTPPIIEDINANPWLKNGEQKAKPSPSPHLWDDFTIAVQQKLALPASTTSDICGAINHAITALQEANTKPDSSSRKILILITDFADSHKKIPPIPPGIEVLSVGVLPDVPIEQLLHTPVKRFESLQGALSYLQTTF
jgi:hypothetical protein